MAARLKLTGQVLAVALVAGLLALLIWKVAHGSGKTAEPKNFNLSRVGTPGKLELASLRGKVVVLNFWASWCIPCKDEAPYLEQVWLDRRAEGVVVLGVDAKDFRSDARGFAGRYDLTYPLAYDGPGATLPSYGVTGFPETYVLDRQGRVVEAFVGSIDSSQEHVRLREAIDRALRS